MSRRKQEAGWNGHVAQPSAEQPGPSLPCPNPFCASTCSFGCTRPFVPKPFCCAKCVRPEASFVCPYPDCWVCAGFSGLYGARARFGCWPALGEGVLGAGAGESSRGPVGMLDGVSVGVLGAGGSETGPFGGGISTSMTPMTGAWQVGQFLRNCAQLEQAHRWAQSRSTCTG